MTFSNQKEEEQEEENDETSDKFGVNTDTHNLVFSTTTTTLESATQTTSFEPTELTEETPSTGDHAAKTRENQAQTAAYINWTIPAPINWTIPTPIKWTIPAPINWTIPTIEENILPVVYGDDVIVTSRGTLIHVPNLTVPVFSLDVLESIALLFFSCDLLLRLVTCPSLKLFCVSVINILDACALASNIAYGFIVHFKREYRYMETRWLDVLTCMQIFRSIRLFRLVKNVRTGKILLYSIRKNVGDFLFLALLLCVGIGMFASLFYFVETRETVYSIPMAWYWSVITMTTIGYGDVAPSTCLGRVVASLCVTGVIMLAISLPMFVNSFIKLNKYASLSESIENETHSSASPHV
ncbi:hypothetical protein DPMN_157831 [Dreissena polymorpha]|uniref:Ion transport domain-containing protein n=1 Tax=Dreissena polymorpha TaxID=45954 RepID=A0A9D4IP78_DREPO|nr:hypothetical protein DPMN_157831 [Dreissena polymorpha]